MFDGYIGVGELICNVFRTAFSRFGSGKFTWPCARFTAAMAHTNETIKLKQTKAGRRLNKIDFIELQGRNGFFPRTFILNRPRRKINPKCFPPQLYSLNGVLYYSCVSFGVRRGQNPGFLFIKRKVANSTIFASNLAPTL